MGFAYRFKLNAEVRDRIQTLFISIIYYFSKNFLLPVVDLILGDRPEFGLSLA